MGLIFAQNLQAPVLVLIIKHAGQNRHNGRCYVFIKEIQVLLNCVSHTHWYLYTHVTMCVFSGVNGIVCLKKWASCLVWMVMCALRKLREKWSFIFIPVWHVLYVPFPVLSIPFRRSVFHLLSLPFRFKSCSERLLGGSSEREPCLVIFYLEPSSFCLPSWRIFPLGLQF